MAVTAVAVAVTAGAAARPVAESQLHNYFKAISQEKLRPGLPETAGVLFVLYFFNHSLHSPEELVSHACVCGPLSLLTCV